MIHVMIGSRMPVEMEPRDTYRVETARIRNAPQTTAATCHPIMMVIKPPDRMPLPPLNPNVTGNM